MRFLIDECTGSVVARWVESQGHDVFSVFDQARGASDDDLITQAFAEDRIVITNDKDFGDQVYRDKRQHRGVILLRLSDQEPTKQIQRLAALFTEHLPELPGRFTVVTEKRIRIRKD